MKFPPYCLQPLPHPSRANACQAIMAAPDGYWVTIQDETRTIEQNRLLWLLFTLWAKHQEAIVNGRPGKQSKETWKVILLHSYRRNHSENLQFALGLDGDLVPLGYETHSMGKHEFAEFLTFVLAESGNRGMELPPRALDECRGYIKRYIKEAA